MIRLFMITAQGREELLAETMAGLAVSGFSPPVEVISDADAGAGLPPLLNYACKYCLALARVPLLSRGAIILEDDLDFRQDWFTLARPFCIDQVLTLYVPSGRRPRPERGDPRGVCDPRLWYGTQALYWPPALCSEARSWIATTPEIPVDDNLRRWFIQTRNPIRCLPVDVIQHRNHLIKMPGSVPHRSDTFDRLWPGESFHA